MPNPGTGRHRRPQRPSAQRLAATTGIAGLILPFAAASGAAAAPADHHPGQHHRPVVGAPWQHAHPSGNNTGADHAPTTAPGRADAAADRGHQRPALGRQAPPSAPGTASPAPSPRATGSALPKAPATPSRPATTPHTSASATGETGSAKPSTQPKPTSSPTASATPSASSTPTSAPTSTPTSAAPSTRASTPAPTGSTTEDAVQQVLAQINKARAAQGLPAYTMSQALVNSASAHNKKMSGGCGLSHQCSGEAAIGDRVTAQGVHWTSVGENIGEGGPVANSSDAIADMALRLNQDMLDEKPPNDGHRKNLLSKDFTHVGIAVYRDSSGTVWLTEDFSS